MTVLYLKFLYYPNPIHASHLNGDVKLLKFRKKVFLCQPYENKTSIPLHEFIKAIMIIINSTFFKFDKKIFRQIFGMPMGSPLSPILANIVLQDLEQEIITTNNIRLFIFVMLMIL